MKSFYTRALLGASMLALVSGAAMAETLNQTLEAAYEHNPRIKAQRQALEGTNEAVPQAFAGFLPKANANYNNGEQRNRFNAPKWGTSHSETRELTVEQPLFRAGGTLSQYASAKEQVMAAREQLRSVEQEVFVDTVSSYMDVLTAREVLILSRDNVNVLKKQLQSSKDRFKVGEVTRTDVAQSEARVARAESDAIQAQGNVDSAIAAFERVAGFKPAGELTFPSDLPEAPKNLDEAVEMAKAESPGILFATYRKNASQEDLWTQKAALLPSVSLQGSMRRADGAGVTGKDEFDTDQLLIATKIPLYQGGGEYARVRESKARTRQRDEELRNANDAAREQVTKAWENLNTTISKIKSQEEQVKAAQVALDGVREEHQYGTRTVLDVLDAEQELFTSRVGLANAKKDRIVAHYTLVQQVGRLSAKNLELKVETYDPVAAFDDVNYKLIGF